MHETEERGRMMPGGSNILYAGAGALAAGCAGLMAATADAQWALRRTPAAGAAPFDRTLTADLSQLQGLALPAAPTHVLYTATPAGRTPQAYQAVYREGLGRLLASLDLRAVRRFVFVSSTAVYGPSPQWVNEDTPAQPQAFNGQELLDAERSLQQTLGDKLVVLRLAGLYGPRRAGLFERLRAGQAVVPDGSGHWLNRLHDDDAARLCAWALGAAVEPGTYIGVDDTPMEMAGLYDTLAAWLGAPPVARGPLAPPTGKRLSNGRLTSLGFRPCWPSTLEGYRRLLAQ